MDWKMKADIAYLIGWTMLIIGAATTWGIAGALMAIGGGMMACSMHATSLLVSLLGQPAESDTAVQPFTSGRDAYDRTGT